MGVNVNPMRSKSVPASVGQTDISHSKRKSRRSHMMYHVVNKSSWLTILDDMACVEDAPANDFVVPGHRMLVMESHSSSAIHTRSLSYGDT